MAISKSKREAVYRKYNGHCAYCGREIAYKDMQVDHFLPLRAWGIRTLEQMTLTTSCQPVVCATTTRGQIRLKRLDVTSQKSRESCARTISTRSELCTARLQSKHTLLSFILSNRR